MSAWLLNSVPLERMSLNDKISLIEKVWDSLTQKDEDFTYSEWNGEVLQQRLDSVENGKAEFHSLDSVR